MAVSVKFDRRIVGQEYFLITNLTTKPGFYNTHYIGITCNTCGCKFIQFGEYTPSIVVNNFKLAR